jgi:CHASE3 domain sensor protein
MVLLLTKKVGKRIIYCFSIVFFLLISIGMVSVSGVSRLSNKFFSMYRDRLEPAMELSYIIERSYQNRLHLEEHVTEMGVESLSQIEYAIYKNNRVIDSLILKYSETYLVPEEIKSLNKYRRNINEYRKLEKETIKLSRERQHQDAMAILTGQSFTLFRSIIEPLERLEEVQLIAGKELYLEAERLALRVNMTIYLAMGIGIVVAIIVATIVSLAYIDR